MKTSLFPDGIHYHFIYIPFLFKSFFKNCLFIRRSGLVTRVGYSFLVLGGCHTLKRFLFSVCDFMYLIYVICLGRLFIGDWRRRHVGSKKLQGEGKRITDLVIESGDLNRR